MKIVCPECDEKMMDETIGWRCPKCKGFVSSLDGKFYPHVDGSFMPPMTNADRIRRMSDEELAKMLNDGCPPGRSYIRCGRDNCIDCWLGWLRQPAEEDT